MTGAKIATDAVGADQLQDGIPIDMQDQLLTRPQLKDYAETATTPVISAGVLTLDLETGNVFDVVLTQNVTSLNLVNAPASGNAGSATVILRQDATGGRTLAWPSSIKWPGGRHLRSPPAPCGRHSCDRDKERGDDMVRFSRRAGLQLMLGVLRAALLSSVAFSRQSYAQMVSALQPLAYWHLGEAGGLLIVDERAVQNGTYQGTTQGTIEYGLAPLVEGSTGSSVGFDGTHTYGEIPHNGAFQLASYTIDFAFQADTAPALGQNRVLFSKDIAIPAPAGALSIEILNSTGQLRLRAYAGGVAGNPIWIGGPGGAADLQLGRAYKVAVTLDPAPGEGARLYLDGEEVAHAPTATVGWTSNNTEPFVIGGYSSAALAKFDGVVDEVALFPLALPASALRRLAQATTIARQTGTSGPVVPRTDVFLTNDDQDPAALGSTLRFAAPGATGSGTSPGDPGNLHALLAAASPGHVIVCAQGYYDAPNGLTFPAGANANNPVTVVAAPGAWAVLCQDVNFLNLGQLDHAPGEGSAKTWTLHDAATNTWRTPYSGGATTLEGCYFRGGMAHMLFPYPSLTALMSARDSGGSKPQTRNQYWFSGTAVSGGFAYVRLDRPNWCDMVNASGGTVDATYGAWPDDGRYTVCVEGGGTQTWFSRSNAADPKTGRPIIGQGLNPNNLRIYLAGTNSRRLLNQNSGNFTRLGSGMNSLGYRYYTTGKSNHEIHRGAHYIRGFFIETVEADVSNITAHRARFFACGEHRLQGSMAVMKFNKFLSPSNQMLEGSHRNGFLSVPFNTTGTLIQNVTLDNCTIAYYHEVFVGSRDVRQIRFVNCAFHMIYDEFGQMGNHRVNQMEVGYCYMLDSAIYNGAGDEGSGTQNPLSAEWYHHNICDQRCPRSAFENRNPAGGPTSMGRDINGQGATKKYNNTIIINPDDPPGRGPTHGWCGNNELISAPSSAAQYEELFNNIFICHDTKRYLSQEGGTPKRTDCVEFGALHKHSNGTPNKCYRDCNLYYRNVQVDPATGSRTRKKFHAVSARYFSGLDYDYVRSNTGLEPGNVVFYGSSEWVFTRDVINQPGGNGWEHNGSDADPQLPSVSGFPTNRGDYRPRNLPATSASATPPSGANWWSSPGWTSYGATPVPFKLAPSAWKGALDPNGSTMPVGVQNP